MGCLKSKPLSNVVGPYMVSSSNQDIVEPKTKGKPKKVTKNKISPTGNSVAQESKHESLGETEIHDFPIQPQDEDEFANKEIVEEDSTSSPVAVSTDASNKDIGQTSSKEKSKEVSEKKQKSPNDIHVQDEDVRMKQLIVEKGAKSSPLIALSSSSKENTGEISNNKIRPIEDSDSEESKHKSLSDVEVHDLHVPSVEFTEKQISENNVSSSNVVVSSSSQSTSKTSAKEKLNELSNITPTDYGNSRESKQELPSETEMHDIHVQDGEFTKKQIAEEDANSSNLIALSSAQSIGKTSSKDKPNKVSEKEINPNDNNGNKSKQELSPGKAEMHHVPVQAGELTNKQIPEKNFNSSKMTVSSPTQSTDKTSSTEKPNELSNITISLTDVGNIKESKHESPNEAKIHDLHVPDVKFTKKQISQQNSTCNRTQVLVPIGGIVYDLKKMCNEVITSQNLDVTSQDVEELQNPSYLRLISTCKKLGMKRHAVKTIQNQCALGKILEAPIEEEQADFEENLVKIFQDSEEEMDKKSCVSEISSSLSLNMELFRENCNKHIGQKFTFSDKAFDPVTGYQGKTDFPLPPWRRPVELRSYLRAPYLLREDGYYKSLLKPLEERKEELIEELNDLIEFMEEVSNDSTESIPEEDTIEEEYPTDACYKKYYWESKVYRNYRLNYWETFLQCCKFQLKSLTMLENHEYGKTDINLSSFPLPGHVKAEDMRPFLLGYSPFDTEIDGRVAWIEMELDVIKNDTSGAKDAHSHFCNLVASGRYDFMDTEVDGDVAWDEMEKDIIKRDKATEAQMAVLKSRECRRDLHDLERMKRRRDKLFKYFQISKESEIYVEYSGWAERLTEGFQLFQDLCKGKYKPTPRQPVDKEAEKEKQYRFALSQVVPLTIKEKKLMKQKREDILKGFIKRHDLDPSIFKQYSSWGIRMEQNDRKLKALCNTKKHAEIVARIKGSKGFLKNFEATWVLKSVFDETADCFEN